MRELTLDQMGQEISAAIQTLTLVQRKVIGELLLSELRRKHMNEPKMGPTETRAEIIRLHREGKMPSLEEVLEAVAKVRAEFAPKILAARRAKKERGAR